MINKIEIADRMPKRPEPCSSEVVAVRDLTHNVKELQIKLIEPLELDFVAGQYITIPVIEMKEGVPHPNNRPYSIVSSPLDKTSLTLCSNRVGDGPGSNYLHGLKPGDLLKFFSPIGYFHVDDQAKTDLLFIATGTGIAPIKSMIHSLLGTGRSVHLYWGLRNEADLYYQEEFSEWANRYSHFTYAMTLSDGSDEWKGMRGRVTDGLSVLIQSVANLDVYLCGNGEMIKAVRDLLLLKGMTKQAIHFEKFY